MTQAEANALERLIHAAGYTQADIAYTSASGSGFRGFTVNLEYVSFHSEADWLHWREADEDYCGFPKPPTDDDDLIYDDEDV